MRAVLEAGRASSETNAQGQRHSRFAVKSHVGVTVSSFVALRWSAVGDVGVLWSHGVLTSCKISTMPGVCVCDCEFWHNSFSVATLTAPARCAGEADRSSLSSSLSFSDPREVLDPLIPSSSSLPGTSVPGENHSSWPESLSERSPASSLAVITAVLPAGGPRLWSWYWEGDAARCDLRRCSYGWARKAGLEPLP